VKPLTKSQRKKAAQEAAIRDQEVKKRTTKRSRTWLAVGLTGIVATAIFFPVGMLIGKDLALIPPKVVSVPPTIKVIPQAHPDENTLDLGHLLSLTPSQLQGIDIAVLNLACSKGLPGCEDLNISTARQELDQWAAHVQAEIIRNHHLFTDNPDAYNNSESYFKALMMTTVLQQDMGIHYNLERMKDWDFTHGENVLLNGLVGSLREGTCSSLPVLYVAVGRRLGWPLYLVATRGHCFVRWESADGKVRFNIEGSGMGMSAYSDEFYQHWPYELTRDDESSGMYLRSMSSCEEFANFLMERGNILEALKRMPEAEMAYAQAHALIPGHAMFFGNLAIAADKERMMASGLLDPNNPQNPYRNKYPPPYVLEPPKQVQVDTVHDGTTAQ